MLSLLERHRYLSPIGTLPFLLGPEKPGSVACSVAVSNRSDTIERATNSQQSCPHAINMRLLRSCSLLHMCSLQETDSGRVRVQAHAYRPFIHTANGMEPAACKRLQRTTRRSASRTFSSAPCNLASPPSSVAPVATTTNSGKVLRVEYPGSGGKDASPFESIQLLSIVPLVLSCQPRMYALPLGIE
jgi:hypothetical protein